MKDPFFALSVNDLVEVMRHALGFANTGYNHLKGCYMDVHTMRCPCDGITCRAVIKKIYEWRGVLYVHSTPVVRREGKHGVWAPFRGHLIYGWKMALSPHACLPAPDTYGVIRFIGATGRFVTIYTEQRLPLDVPICWEKPVIWTKSRHD